MSIITTWIKIWYMHAYINPDNSKEFTNFFSVYGTQQHPGHQLLPPNPSGTDRTCLSDGNPALITGASQCRRNIHKPDWIIQNMLRSQKASRHYRKWQEDADYPTPPPPAIRWTWPSSILTRLYVIGNEISSATILESIVTRNVL